MKKFAMLAALFCFPIVGITGCGGGGNEIVEVSTEEPEISEAEQAQMDKEMEEAMSQQGN